jgi:transcriptional regulator with PAS, ATPase and Fis domain
VSSTQTIEHTDSGVLVRQPTRPGLLLVFSGNSPCLESLPIARGPVEIGRDVMGALGVEVDGRMSRSHSSIDFDGTEWRIRDLNSRNGTFVDGLRIDGELITGSATLLRAGGSLFLLCRDITRFVGGRVEVRDGIVVGPTLRLVRDQIEAAGRNGHVLHMTGETGAGKEIAARWFHGSGERARRPFVAVNCAAIPAGLAERLFFGARRGAFSGADSDVEGYVQAADTGTLFLDEVGELEASIQAKLLRVLETREVLPLGASKSRSVDFALVSATHADLRGAVSDGKFRADLFFRLGRPAVVAPSLRERREDIPWIIGYTLSAEGSEGADVSLIEAALLRRWPGNARELVVEIRSAVMAAGREGRVRARHLAPLAGNSVGAPAGAEPEPEPEPEAWRGLTRARIDFILRREQGNVSSAARALGIHRTQLRRLLQRFGIEP